MASDLSYAQYISDQISGAGSITLRKMFGEYGIYCNDKLIGLICDNSFFVKITEAGAALFPKNKKVSPYVGAKPYFLIEDIDDREWLTSLILATYHALPERNTEKKKRKSK